LVNRESPKTQKNRAILQIRAKTLGAARTWFNQNDFTEVQGPTIIPAVGDRPNCFPIKYFNKKAYLSGGLQPYSYAFLKIFEKIYTIAPTFRAEKLKTKRHLTEYWRIEAAASNFTLDQIMDAQENLLTHICQRLTENAASELKQLNRSPETLNSVTTPLTRLTYDQTIEILQKQGQNIQWGEQLTPEIENKLSLQFKQPFFITQFPLNFETFFHKSNPKKPELTLTADLIAPEGYGEIASSGEMITNKKILQRKMVQAKIDFKDQEWYLAFIKQDSNPHSAFAIGLERLIQWICKLENINQAIAFPRTYTNNYP